MARFSFGIWDSTSSTYLSGESVQVKDALGGTVLASTVDIGVGLLISPNGDGTYYCDDIPSQDLWVYIDGAIQQELAGIPWDDGDSSAHIAADAAHGSDGDIMGQNEVDGASIEYSGGLRVKALGILEAMLGAGSVVETKIGNAEVSAAKLKSDSVTTAKILDANVTGAKIAAAAAGKGLKKDASSNLEVEISTVAAELDFEFNAANQLKLIKSFSSTNYLGEDKTFSQLMSIIDNRMRQNANLSGSGSGSFYEQLFGLYAEDTSPSSATLTPLITCVSTTYGRRLDLPFIKTPEMRQLVYYFYAQENNASGKGWVKLFGDALSVESAGIEGTGWVKRALYLDISSLSNWEIHHVYIDMRTNNGSYQLQVASEVVIARALVTSLSGEPSYEQENPVE